jgi:hypothetical protein
LRGPAEELLTAVGDAFGRLRPESELGWLSGALVGDYYVAIASSILLLAIHVVGFVYWFADNRIDSWQARLRASGAAIESNPRFHASRIIRAGIHLLFICWPVLWFWFTSCTASRSFLALEYSLALCRRF